MHPRPQPHVFRTVAPTASLAALALAACALALAPGCSKEQGAAPDEPGLGRAFLSIGTAPPGGAFFQVGSAIGETLNSHKGDNQWEFTAEATKGSQENIRRLDRGELDLALSNAAITYFAVRGEGDWEKKYPMRSVMTLAPNVALFVAPRSSRIASIADLKGKRVSVGPAGAGFRYFIEPILAAHGLSYDDFDENNATQSSAVDLLSDGAIDAAFLGGAIPTASITQAATSMDLVFVPFDPAARQELIDAYSFFRPATIPAGTYRGQDAAFEGLDVGSMHLITSADKADELVYQLTKTIWENRQSVVDQHPAGRAINESNVVRDTGTPFHPGAVRYFREIGIWPADRLAEGAGGAGAAGGAGGAAGGGADDAETEGDAETAEP